MTDNQQSSDDTLTARDRILGRLREAGSGSGDSTGCSDSVTQHMQGRQRHTPPTWPDMGNDTERLINQMGKVQITLTRLQTAKEIPEAVEEYRREHDIGGELIVSPVLASNSDMQWDEQVKSGIARDVVSPGGSSPSEVTSVTPCLCAVAESGSIVTASSDGTPSTLNFLPDNHVVVLYENQIVRYLEDAFSSMRDLNASAADSQSSSVPRALNLITGPSRTADIEQTIELGAHGPKRMHVLLVASTV